jgi:hypothetical protein
MSNYTKVLQNFISLIMALIGFAGLIVSLVSQPQQLHIFATLSYCAFLIGILWFAFGKTEIKQIWRWLGLGLLFVITIPFCIWVGTWINLQGNIRPIAEDEKGDILSIWSIPSFVVAYGGDTNPADTSGGTGHLTVIHNENIGTGYLVDYYLPDAGEGYAGLAFKFVEPQDLSSYEFVEITVSFGDEQARCDFFMKDISDQTDLVLLSNTIPSNTDIILNVIDTGQIVRIPFTSNFAAVNRKFIKEIGCNANTDFLRGKHTFTISGIKFLN